MDGIPRYLADHRFAELFRDDLGWDRASGTIAIHVDGRHLAFEAIAQKRGLQVLQCTADRLILCNRGLLRRAQRQIARAIHEHILIYSCNKPPKQVWQWAVRMPDGSRQRYREHPFFSGSPPAALLERLSWLRFTLDEESDVTFVDALRRVRVALDASPEQNLFARRPWYAERSDKLAVAMARGDADAFEEFIVLHRPLARHISKPLERLYGMDSDDAEQIGVIGLIEAARRFDPERGIQFSSYACHWVRQTCRQFGPEAALFIRLPVHVVQSFFPLRRRIENLASALGPGGANDELARLSSENAQFFRRWLGFERALNVRSLSDRREPEYFEARTLPAPVDDERVQDELQKERVEGIRSALRCLKARQRRFIRLRYGMGSEPRTLGEIGRAEGITSERVRQILAVAEKQLRFFLECKLKGLVPAGRLTGQETRTGIRDDHHPRRPNAQQGQFGRSSNGTLASSGVSVLTQEKPQLAGLDLERIQESAEQVADSIGGQVAFHEQPIVDPEGLPE